MGIKKKLLVLTTSILVILGLTASPIKTPSLDVKNLSLTWVDSSVVYANSKVKPFVVLDSDSGVSSVVANINADIQTRLRGQDKITEGWQFLTYNASLKRVELDKEVYASQHIGTRRIIMDIALTQLSQANSGGLGERDRARLYNFVQSQDKEIARVLQAINSDVQADIAWGMRVLDYVKSPINNFLGVLVILVAFMVGLQIAMDTFLMVTPPAMYWIMEKYGNKKPAFISPEAWHSYRDATSSSKYKDYFMTYLFRSIPKLIVTGICLSYIIVGNIVFLAIFFADLFAR